jgi:hypothetical protein
MVMAGAMVYMYWLGMPLTGPPNTALSMSGPPLGAGDPSLTLLLVGVLLASAIWQLDSVSRLAPARQRAQNAVGGRTLAVAATVTGAMAGTGSVGVGAEATGKTGERPWLAPRLEIGCHVAMCLTMGYMLVLLI